MMRSIRSVSDLANKRVLLRVDFDVPIVNGKISDPFRIEKQKENIQYLIERGAIIALVGHIKDSFAPILDQIRNILNIDIQFTKKIEDLRNIRSITLLENIRSFTGETGNDDIFAKSLADGFEIYVNNGFAVCHRNHASVSAITKYLPSYTGLQLEKEIANLQKVMNDPAQGKIIVMGGAKAETKVPVIRYFLNKSRAVLTGGVVANDILKERGIDIQNSISDANSRELLSGFNLNDPRLATPLDYLIEGGKIMDIGPKTADIYEKIISQAGTVIWNGPMGMYENEKYASGTKNVAWAISNSHGWTVVGGNNTIAAIKKMGINLNKFKFVSTGGGAMLEYLAGKQLPGIVALQ